MKLTKDFDILEFNCRDGRKIPLQYIKNVQLLADNLQVLRDHIEEPININSCYRPPDYNKKVGGKPASQHLTASAADITTKSYTPKELAAVVEKLIKDGKMKQGGLGIYPSFIHYDVRKRKARW